MLLNHYVIYCKVDFINIENMNYNLHTSILFYFIEKDWCEETVVFSKHYSNATAQAICFGLFHPLISMHLLHQLLSAAVRQLTWVWLKLQCSCAPYWKIMSTNALVCCTNVFFIVLMLTFQSIEEYNSSSLAFLVNS